MKWAKQPYCPKANTHRAGWKFWDLVDDDDRCVAFVRYRPDYGYDIDIGDLVDEPQAIDYNTAVFTTLKEAKGHVMAIVITKKLEDQ